MEDFLIFNGEENKHKFSEDVADIENTTDIDFSKILEEMEKKYESYLSETDNANVDFFSRIMNTVKSLLSGRQPELSAPGSNDDSSFKARFLEPDIDDYVTIDEGPPLKRMRSIDEPVTTLPDQIVTMPLNRNHVGVNTRDK